MKRLLVLILILGYGSIQAQMQFEGSLNHGVLSNFAYHHSMENKVYASIANKLLTSTDNGENWNVIYTSPTFSEVTNLKVINDNELVFQEHYGISFNNNIAVLNVADNSISKRIPVPTMHGKAELDYYDIMASNSDVVFLNLNVSSTKGFGMYTNNAGLTWHTVYKAGDYVDNIKITSLAISDQDPNKLVITRSSGSINNNFEGGGLWISEDAGNTWVVHLDNILLRKVAINPNDDDEILTGTALRWNVPAQHQAVYRTLNNGQDWEEIDVEWDEGWGGGSQNYITGINFNPHKPGNIVITGDNEIVSTTDDGLTWNNTTYPDGPSANVESYFHAKSVTFDPFNSGRMLISNGYYPLESADGGITTSRFYNRFYSVTGDVSVFSDANQTDIYHGVHYGYVHTDVASGDESEIDVFSLDTRFQFGPPSVRLQADKQIPGRVLIYTTASFGIHLKVSEDYGQTKQLLYQNNTYRYTGMRIDPNNSQIVWLNLEDINFNSAIVRVDFNDMADIKIDKITLPKTGKLYSIEIDPQDSSQVYLAIDSQVYFSDDNGENWMDISNDLENILGPQDYVLSLKSNPIDTDQLSIATNKGLFTTFDKGTTWNELYGADVFYLEHSSAVDGHLVALAYTEPGAQTFKLIYSIDNGETWEEISNEELNLAEANNMADTVFEEEAIKVYMGTTSLGLVTYSIDLSFLATPGLSKVKNNFSVYPNPTVDLINITSPNNIDLASLRVYSISGSKLIEVENTNTISLSGLQRGIYFVEIVTPNGQKETHKIIKK